MNKTSVVQQSKVSSFIPHSQSILQRKCACGNHTTAGGECAECAKKKMGLQRKLAIGASNDPLEQEADRVADRVMAASLNSAVNATPPRIQRLSGQASGDASFAPPSVDRVLAGSGRPLGSTLRQDMEQRFGYDFSQVRVHTGSAAEQSAQDVNALAYTVGNNVVFGAGQFTFGSHDGRKLLAHELTHVVQQSGAELMNVSRNKRTMKVVYRRLQRLGGNPGCTPVQTSDIHQAIFNANSWVGKALTALGETPLATRTLRALGHNFGVSGNAANAGPIAATLRAGRVDMLKNPYACANAATDAFCASGNCGDSLPGGHTSNICTNVTLASNAVFRAGCVLHEAMHASNASMSAAADTYSGWFGNSSSMPGYPGASPLANADSYTTLAMELS